MCTPGASGTAESSGHQCITGQIFFHVLPASNHQFFTFDERKNVNGVSTVDFPLPVLDHQPERRPLFLLLSPSWIGTRSNSTCPGKGWRAQPAHRVWFHVVDVKDRMADQGEKVSTRGALDGHPVITDGHGNPSRVHVENSHSNWMVIFQL